MNYYDTLKNGIYEYLHIILIIIILLYIFFLYFYGSSIYFSDDNEDLIDEMLLSVFAIFLFMNTRLFSKIINKKESKFDLVIVSIFFGFLSIVSTIYLDTPSANLISFRNTAPIIAGLIGGPLVGITTGFIGGSICLLTDGYLGIPFFIVTIIAGLSAGLLVKKYGNYSYLHLILLPVFIGTLNTIAFFLTMISTNGNISITNIHLRIIDVFIPICVLNIFGLFVFKIYCKALEDRNAIGLMETGLNNASLIQKSSLPSIYPNVPEFDLFADLESAKNVAGDFYDFFFLDKTHFAVIIADVSDKGLPAALFMMRSKATIKCFLEICHQPEDVFSKVNEELCYNNAPGMFLTAWMGILDLDSGMVTYVNAGHTSPYIKRADRSLEKIKMKPGLLLGYMPDYRYKSGTFQLFGGDTLFLYTDGVVEESDMNDSLYGNKRLSKILSNNSFQSPKEMILAVQKDIDYFVGTNSHSDDITMLAIGLSKGFTRRLTIPAVAIHLNEVINFVKNMLTEFNCQQKLMLKVSIAVEEIFVNICTYAYKKEGYVTIHCSVLNEMIQLTFIDEGKPFNPMDQKEPDTKLNVDEREIGGLGIFIAKKLVTKTEYKYINGQNIFTIKVKIHDN